MLQLNSDNFEKEVLNAQGKVVVDFWASWCGPCKMLAPIFEETALAHPEVKFAKVNVDEQEELAIRYKVSAIPTVLLFENGDIVDKFVGLRDRQAIEEFIG
ncbi:MAG: thioredoxin [Clostridia bacterium]|nr:thioredoxin [Clostridia bacterium]